MGMTYHLTLAFAVFYLCWFALSRLALVAFSLGLFYWLASGGGNLSIYEELGLWVFGVVALAVGAEQLIGLVYHVGREWNDPGQFGN